MVSFLKFRSLTEEPGEKESFSTTFHNHQIFCIFVSCLCQILSLVSLGFFVESLDWLKRLRNKNEQQKKKKKKKK